MMISVDLAASIEPRSQSDEIGYYLAHVQMSNELETKQKFSFSLDPEENQPTRKGTKQCLFRSLSIKPSLSVCALPPPDGRPDCCHLNQDDQT